MRRFVLPFLLLLALCATVPAAIRAHVASDTPVLAAQRSAAPAPITAAALPQLKGFVGPGYDIVLRDAGGDVRGRQIPAGTYELEINDFSEIHNFELKGDGVDVETEEEFTGRQTFVVTLRAGGHYEFECDPHHDFMYGSFSAVAGPPPTPPPPPPPPPPAGPGQGGGTLLATVRPDYTIELKHENGASVRQVAPGRYTIRVDDQAPQHNFHLSGPGVNQATSVEGTGIATWTVTLANGTYTFVCDPHADAMRGSFAVAEGAAPPSPPPPGAQPPASTPPAPKAPGVLIATVRANYSIDVKHVNGAKVDAVQAGTYTIEVRDQTKDHNFHLSGPGVEKTTTVAYVGTTKWSVVLKPGSYRFVCDPHAPLMKGAFTVTAGAPQALKVSALRVSKVGRQLLVRLRVNKSTRARIRLLRRGRAVASVGAVLKAGANAKRVRLPARAPRGAYRVQITLADGAKRQTLTRAVRI